MEMTFDRHEPCKSKVVFALTLDRKKEKERILIGTQDTVWDTLTGRMQADLLCDTTRTLGTFLAEFEHDEDSVWNTQAIRPLYTALKFKNKKMDESKRISLEQPASDFLQSKYSTGNPVCMYAAFRIWDDYLRMRDLYRNRDMAQNIFMTHESRLTKAFLLEPPLEYDPETGRPKTQNIYSHSFRGMNQQEAQLSLWYPAVKGMSETVVAYSSFSPIIAYYSERLHDWGLCVRICKVCGKLFLAKNQRYELCSDACRKKQSLQNKRDFDERARENNYDLLYKNECQNWRNKINKAKKTPGFPAGRLEEMQAAFKAFKAEALRRKTAVKNGTAGPKEFSDWLYQQSHIIAELAECETKQNL